MKPVYRFWLVACITCCQVSLLSAQPVSGPREMLDIMKIDASQRKHFVDDRSMNEEGETLGRLLFRLPNFSQVDLDRWTQPIAEVEAMLRNPDSYRFELYEVRGNVVDLQQHQVLSELVPRLGFQEYFAVTISHNATQSILYTRTIPKAWRNKHERDPNGEMIRAQALLLKRGLSKNKPALIFAAPRLNWHPQESSKFTTTPDQVLLGQLGLDVDRLFDLTQRSKMSPQDRECFYQSLSAVRLAEPEQLAKLGRREFEIGQMIQTPEQVVGELYTLHGLARRAIMIRVQDKDVRERFQLDHYYEIEVFMPLERQVRFLDPSEPKDKVGKVFTEYPFVVCVAELPEGMQQGDDIRVPVTFSGFFLKLWAYETEFMTGGRARTAKPRLQQSPLFVGPTVTVGELVTPQESHLGLIIASLFTALLLVVWFLLWRSSIQDKRAAKQLFRKHEPEEGAFDLL